MGVGLSRPLTVFRIIMGKCLACGSDVPYDKKRKRYKRFCNKECMLSENGRLSMLSLSRSGCIKKHGTDNYAKTEEYAKKRKKTCLERYGVESYSATNECKEKIKRTCLERYGVDHYSKTKEQKDRVRSTCLERYGVDNMLKHRKTRKAFTDKYGVSNPVYVDSIKEKTAKTNVSKYGFACVLLSDKVKKSSILKVKSRRYESFLAKLSAKCIMPQFDKQYYLLNNPPFEYKCTRCNELFTTDNTNPIRVCCLNHPNSSKSEESIARFIEQETGLTVEQRYKLTFDNKTIEIDVFIPSLLIGIEFNGMYWHSNIHKNKTYHQDKKLLCHKSGIDLISVFENDWVNNERVVKSIILSRLGFYKKTIYARKCTVHVASNKEYNAFMNENHLSGTKPASIKLALLYDGVPVMMASMSNKNKYFELERMATKIGYKVTGGFSKLIKRLYEHVKLPIHSYINYSYFNGEGYKSVGFTITRLTKPGYCYFKNSNRTTISRQMAQKKKLPSLLSNFNPDLSEQDNMTLNGYLVVNDCGNLVATYDVPT